MSYYRYHLFFCTNARDDGSPCCAHFSAREARSYLKEKAKAVSMHGEGAIRVNSAGCLGRCEQGPVLVVYPEEVWYTYVDHEDLDEIFEQHLLKGTPVERLMLPKP